MGTRGRPLLRTALAIALGAGLASFYLIPAVYEMRWVNIGEVLSPGVRPQDNFLFTTLADPDHNRFNLLVSTVALTEIGVLALAIWGSRRWKKHVGTAAPGCPVARSATGLHDTVDPAFRLGRRQRDPDVFGEQFALAALAQAPLRATSLPLAAVHECRLGHASDHGRQTLDLAWLASALLLAAVIVAGYRIQPPWWETASDIREMSNALADGTGYEGTDEYVPAGADSYELNKSLPLVSDDAGAPVPSQMLAWGPIEKHFTVHAATPRKSDRARFQLPGVGSRGKRQTRQNTNHGCDSPDRYSAAAGDSDVHIYFRRTNDRGIGNAVSLISLGLLIAGWTMARPKPTQGQPV